MNLGSNILLGMPALLGAVSFVDILFVYLAVPGLSCGMWDFKPRAPVLGVQSLSHLDSQESPKGLVSNDCEFLLLLLCKLDCLDMREEIAGAASQGYGGKGESDLHSDLNLLALCV